MLVAILATSGCASPPQAEKKAAEEAVRAAETGGAPIYAPEELAVARHALKSAAERLAAKQYADAKSRYLEAKDLGGKAAKTADAKRAAMKPEVDQQLDQVDKRWESLAGRVKASGSRLNKDRRQEWEADSTTVAQILQGAKTLAGSDPVRARGKLGTLAVFFDKWEGVIVIRAVPAKETKPPSTRGHP